MNFLSMSYFLTVSRQRSITRAAEELHITQQTLSGHIAALENELGCPLLYRRIPLELTYAGQVFVRYAEDFMRRKRVMAQEFSDLSGAQSGVLRIGVAYTRGRTILPDILERYAAAHPRVELLLDEDTNEQLLAKLRKNEVDLMIGQLPDQLPDVAVRDFYEEEVLLILPRVMMEQQFGTNCADTLRQLSCTGDFNLLANCPFLLGGRLDIAGQLARQLLSRADFFPVIRMESNNVETLLELCVRGAGICFCPDRLLYAILKPDQLSRLHLLRLPQSTRYQIRFGWLRQPRIWSALEEFVDLAITMQREESLK